MTGELEAIERASQDELRALQLQRLRWSLRHVYENVSLYRDKCQGAGVHPHDLRTLADLERFPFMQKDDLRAGYPFGLFAVPREQIVRIHASSGTRGKPTVVGYTRNDLGVWSEVMARTLAMAGVGPGMVLHNAYGYGLFTGGLGFHMGAELLGCTVLPIS